MEILNFSGLFCEIIGLYLACNLIAQTCRVVCRYVCIEFAVQSKPIWSFCGSHLEPVVIWKSEMDENVPDLLQVPVQTPC